MRIYSKKSELNLKMDKLKTRILLISLLLVLLLSLQGVSAVTDDNENLASESIDLSICDNTDDANPDKLSTADTSNGQEEVLSTTPTPFSELYEEIATGGKYIELAHDYYAYEESDPTIEIYDDIVIDGKGAVIDMAESNIRAFYINSNYGVTIKNLTIKNVNYDKDGGAIYFYESSHVNIMYCNFINNTASGDGGAIYFGSTCHMNTVTNCNFTDNQASGDGGAVYFGDDGTVTNCNFNNNTAYNGGAIDIGYGIVENCSFSDNSASGFGGAIKFSVEATVTNCSFSDNSAGQGGAIFAFRASVENCNFTVNTANHFGGAIYVNNGIVENCNFTDNTASGDGGAIFFSYDGNVTNCNFTGNNAINGSAIYFWTTSATNTVSNSRFLNNRANAEALEVTKNDNNITITFTGKDNLLNAIYSEGDVTFTNVFYWSVEGITNTGSSAIKPTRSNKEAGQNITVGVVVNGELVLSDVKVTDENGMIVLDISAGENYYISAHHDADSYYTEAEKTISNNTKFSVNVTSQTTNNRTVNITAKSNIPNEFIKGKLLFILPDSNEITANYAGNGTWWVLYTFADYGVYEVNASYTGLDNVTVNKANITVNKANSTLTVGDIVFDYNSTGSTTISYTGATGVNASIDDQPDANVNVNGNIITVSGLDAGNYTLSVTTIADVDHNNVTRTAKVTVNKINSTLTVGNVIFDYNSTGSTSVSYDGASGVNASVIGQPDAVVDVEGNIITVSGLDAGNYTLTVTTIADANHNNVTKNAKITVNKINSTLTVSDVVFSYGDSGSVVVSFTGATGVNAGVVEHPDAVVNIEGNTITVSGLDAGNYTLTVTTIADANHNNVTRTADVIVRHVVTVTVDPVTGHAGEVVNVTAQFRYENGDLVNDGVASLTVKYVDEHLLAASLYSISSADEYVPVSDGKATFNVILGAPGTYPYVVTYSSEDTDDAQAESTLTILKAVTTVSGVDISGKPGDEKDITVTVSDQDNKSVSNGTVTLTLNGKPYNASVENGKAVFHVELSNPGEYNATVIYNGNDYYNSSSSSISVNVEKVNTKTPSAEDVSGKAGEKTDIRVEIVDEKGKPVKNGTAALTIDGKTYTAEVIDGVAAFKDVVLPEKDTVADVYYQGNDYYNASSTTISIKVKQDNNNTKPDSNSTENKTAEHASTKAVDGNATGNPMAMFVLALFALVITYRKKIKL